MPRADLQELDAAQRSPNVLSLGDTLWCSLYGFGRLYYPDTEFLVRIAGFTDRDVHVEAVERGPYGEVENEWDVPYSWLRRERPTKETTG